MTDQITPAQFHASDGVADWHVVYDGAVAHFATGSFAAGLRLVNAVAALAEEVNHHPDVDLRYAAVTVRLISHDVGGLSRRDADLARQISAAARDLSVPSEPALVQTVQLTIDTRRREDVMGFWRTVLGYRADGDQDLVDGRGRGPSIWFQLTDEERTDRNRIHVDVSVPHDQAEARVTAALAAGGRLVDDSHAPHWWVLADAEGNEACVAVMRDRG